MPDVRSLAAVVGEKRGRWRRGDFAGDAVATARALLGQRLVRVLPSSQRLAGVIVEVEAYLGPEDRASHAFGGRRTARNESMYARPGTAYVYFTYGMHDMFNVVCGAEGVPVAVLVRAIEPTEGLEVMRANRSARKRGAAWRDTDLCSGPGKLCQALSINRSLNGLDLATDSRLFIERGGRRVLRQDELANTPRIGVENSAEWAECPLRWFIKANPHVSRS